MVSSAATDPNWWSWTLDVLWHLPVPVLALSLPMAAMFERLQSQAISEAVHQPFVLAAVPRGVREETVSPGGLRHALRDPRFVGGLWLNTLPALLFGERRGIAACLAVVRSVPPARQLLKIGSARSERRRPAARAR